MYTSKNDNLITTALACKIPVTELKQTPSSSGHTSERTLPVKKSYRRKRKYNTEEERLQANRKSAAESRLRKKILLNELLKEVDLLKNENSMLQIENEIMKKRIRLSQTSVSVAPFVKNNPLCFYSVPSSLAGNPLKAVSHPVLSMNNPIHCGQLIKNHVPIGLNNVQNMKQHVNNMERFGYIKELMKTNVMRQQANELMRLATVQKIA